MAITRLTDLITVFDSKWTYGDVKFGYDGEVNQDHDTQYPLMMVTPPESIMPVVYDGREEYSFEINFYNLYSQAAQSVVTLQKRWDNLQDLSNEWLDMVLKNYQDNGVDAYLNDESIEIERIKDSKNDKLVQIKLTFTMSAFTKCFRPISNYPSDFSDLVVWLRADSGITFDIPTKQVSAWADKSGQNNNASQPASLRQPLRYGYDGQNDKAYIDFNGASKSLFSDSNSPITTDFTIFSVSKINAASNTVFGYSHSNATIDMGTDASGKFKAVVEDGTTTLTTITDSSVLNKGNIAILKKSSKTINLEYYDSSTSDSKTDTDVSFNETLTYNQNVFYLGTLAGGNLLNGQMQEVIVYNRALSASEISDVKGYLNLKYKIY
tara:strand:+ start:310 stop:1449 length:1140 start_codon:yes stop_codon:yes gene_type:complete